MFIQIEMKSPELWIGYMYNWFSLQDNSKPVLKYDIVCCYSLNLLLYLKCAQMSQYKVLNNYCFACGIM